MTKKGAVSATKVTLEELAVKEAFPNTPEGWRAIIKSKLFPVEEIIYVASQPAYMAAWKAIELE